MLVPSMPTPSIRRVHSRRGARLVGLALLAGFALASCDRAIEPYVPGEQAEAPDLARIFPEGAERSLDAEAPPSAGAGGAPPAAPAAAAGNEAIRGTISLAPEFEGRVPAGAILFLIARRGEGGPPLAVQRVVEPQFPLDFSIGPDDRMIEQMPFAGPLQLTARLDADGNAMTRQPGDLQGTAPGSYEPGASDVTIVVDEAL
jgi:hypothetical protein